ncbi:19775_t:CDS:2 [Cetraspora pellucida]|uniref:19775_t:CDS:1 n=1 Tax=Cetraspora pellucida TaxID=1433469 RepID=A0A9N8WFH8_9GLOM|nr:19775_t:CDS:2 [Cetraspora pellucida]
MFGLTNRSTFSIHKKYHLYSAFLHHQQFKYSQQSENGQSKYNGYWNLQLQQPAPSSYLQDPSYEEHHHTDIASTAINTNSPEEIKPVITIDGELIPPKPVFPDNCCMSVLDIYQDDLNEWKEKTNRIRERLLQEGKPLPPILLQSNDNTKEDDIDPGMKAFLELEKKLAGTSS